MGAGEWSDAGRGAQLRVAAINSRATDQDLLESSICRLEGLGKSLGDMKLLSRSRRQLGPVGRYEGLILILVGLTLIDRLAVAYALAG